MPRSMNRVASRQRRKKLIKEAKGHRGGRGNLLRPVRDGLQKARVYAYRDRKVRKREFRQLWIMRIAAAAKSLGISYSQLMGQLNKSGVEINRKALSELAISDFGAFKQLVDELQAHA